MIPFDKLSGWALGELAEEEAEEVEEHLFGCDDCARVASLLTSLREPIAALVRDGRLRFAMTGALLERVAADALPVRRYVIEPGGTVPCSADLTQVYAITQLNADLSGLTRVSARVVMPDGTVVETIEDVPFDARQGAVVMTEQGDMVRSWPTMLIEVQLVGFDADGASRPLGTYRLSHTGMSAS